MKNIYNFLEAIFWGAFKKRRDEHWGGVGGVGNTLKIKQSHFKMLQAKTTLLFSDWLIQGDSQGLEHLKTLLWWWFFLDKDILWTCCGVHIANLCLRWYIAIHPLFVQPRASFSHFVRKDQILAQWWRWFSLDTIASPVSLLNHSSGENHCSAVHACGCRRGVSTALTPPVPVGALGGDVQAGWGMTGSIFSLPEILLCLYKFWLEIFSFPVYSKELSKLEKLLKQELFSPLDQVMLYSVFNWGKKNFHNPVIPLFILFTLWSIIIFFNSVILIFHGLIHFSIPIVFYIVWSLRV